MEAFILGHDNRVKKDDKKFLMPIFSERLNVDELTPEVSMYLEANVFIDARKLTYNANSPHERENLEAVRKEIRYYLPGENTIHISYT